ncbi:tyrosine-type recombinase/integrase [Luteolibacter sp. Populi]|uniref:tyrosine-type recombinase/integrase n=1 Tax=Luteolibacter sp. Populi TaxID=3230487 RepID=UPI003466C9B1
MKGSEKGEWKQVGENLVRHAGGSYYLRAKVGGKVIRMKLDAPDLRIAKLQRDDRLTALRAAALETTTSNVRTMGDAITLVSDRLLKGAHLEQPTVEYYAALIEILRKTLPCDLPGKSWTATQAAAWWKKIATKYAAQRANNILSMARRVTAALLECGVRLDDPARELKRVKILAKNLSIPTRELIDQIIDSIASQGKRASKESAAFVGFLAYAGCRYGQAKAVTWENVSQDWITFDSGVRGSKSASQRNLPIFEPLRKVLDPLRYEGATGPIFKLRSPRIALANACVRLGVPHLRLHDLRHFFATFAIEAGVDIPTVAKWLGHKDGGALLIRTYSHVRDKHSLESAKKLV